ncbi:short-chain dehydrogenase [Acidobacteria bacterium Mor1]|nr:short-chain dehydrogenase [Acidobacteria bacterium Mor1]
MTRLAGQVVCITGASSGIGAACARTFAREGSRLLLAARRLERLEALESELRAAGAAGIRSVALDVRDREAVIETFESLDAPWRDIDVLVNNAGLSRGLDPLHRGLHSDWEEMLDTNVKGLLWVDRVVVPGMVERKRGTVIHIGSIAGRQVYPGGNVYCASKHAVRALTDGLRLDVNGSGVRVMSVDPGMVDTEFSEVRFHGDRDKAGKVYRGMQPLSGDDVAEVVRFAASLPEHVVLAETLLLPTDQASATTVHRKG